MVGQIRRQLRQRGLARNTYVVFSSDNGYHMGERRMGAGKMTPYDTDIRVPLIVVGPGVPRGAKNSQLAANIDLAPTFMQLGGTTSAARYVDGVSLAPLLHGQRPQVWRDEVLIEHHHPQPSADDPDRQTPLSGNPPSYYGLRTRTYLYVEYADGDREFYDLRKDPNELDNRYEDLDEYSKITLSQRLAELKHCRGNGCRRVSTP
jgi:N-acetylglucosamine-6-sulfatase